MKTIAIIAEYNPFHNGHQYQLNKAKEITGADYSIAVMSGNFLQRGTPAMWDKYTRAGMAVSGGIDMVLELPFVYATGSAQDFAMGAVTMLNKLNSVDCLCFGAETEDLKSMSEIGRILTSEPEDYKIRLQNNLSSGMSYPAAREAALLQYLERNPNSSITAANISDLVSLPNNTLALEYICALLRTKSTIKPILILREASDYRATNLQEQFSSANAIRHTIMHDKHVLGCKNQVPATTFDLLQQAMHVKSPIISNHLSELLQGVRLSQSYNTGICDFDNDLFERFQKQPLQITFDDMIAALSTKNKTKSRVSRALIHYLLGYTQEDRSGFQQADYCFYANLLAFRRESCELLKHINDNSSIKTITKKADYAKSFPENLLAIAARMWNLDTKATEIYNLLVYNHYGTLLPNDYKQSPVII